MQRRQSFPVIHGYYAALLRECDTPRDLGRGKTIHSRIRADGLHADTFLANLIVQMYGRCGSIRDAIAAFESIGSKNIFSFAIMITALDHHRDARAAIDVYRGIDSSLVPDDVTNVAILGACSSLGDLSVARAIHREILDRAINIGTKVYNALITTYTKCGSISDAKAVFAECPKRNLVSWNAMISAYARSGHSGEALLLLWKMDNEGEQPDSYTFCSILAACSSKNSSSFEVSQALGSGSSQVPGRTSSEDLGGATSQHPGATSQLLEASGRMIHERVVALGLESDVGIGTCLTTFYSKLGQLDQARIQFQRTQPKNVVSWNAIMGAASLAGKFFETLELHRSMDVEPDATTFSIALTACASSGDLDRGREIHESLKNTGLIAGDAIVQNALLNLYAKCGDLESAARVLESIGSKNIAAWNSLMAAYAQSGDPAAAATLYKRLVAAALVDPDAFTFSTVLGAVAAMGAIEEAAILHREIVARGFLRDEVVLKALLNAYCKCGSLEDAREIFAMIKNKDTISWTSMILGFAQHGRVPEALELFQCEVLQGLVPDYVTYTSILHACSHHGLARRGMEILRWMERDHGIRRTREHYHCAIDMLARLGELDQAEELLKNFSYECEGDTVAWISLLSGFRTGICI